MSQYELTEFEWHVTGRSKPRSGEPCPFPWSAQA